MRKKKETLDPDKSQFFSELYYIQRDLGEYNEIASVSSFVSYCLYIPKAIKNQTLKKAEIMKETDLNKISN